METLAEAAVAPLMEFQLNARVICKLACGSFGFAADFESFACFQSSTRCHHLAVPWFETDPGSFVRSPCSCRVPSLGHPLAVFRLRAGLPGFMPSSRYDQSASTEREGFQTSATFRPQAFSASRRFAPRPGAVGLFRPTTTSRVHPVQGVLSRHSRTSLPKPLPPCR